MHLLNRETHAADQLEKKNEETAHTKVQHYLAPKTPGDNQVSPSPPS